MSSRHSETRVQELNRLLKHWAVVLTVAGIFMVWAGWRLARATHQFTAVQPAISGSKQPRPDAADAAPKQWYRCTMPECGDVGSADSDSRCPVCGMRRELVADHSDTSREQVTLDDRARKLADVATEPVARRLLFKHIRTVGHVSYDETRRQIVSAYTAGRIDHLYADYSGMLVKKKDRLAEVYSPELISLQEEYLRRIRARQSSDQVWQSWAASSRRRLELLGFSLEQIKEIEQTNEPATHLVVTSPIGGTIVRKNCVTGTYVSSGDQLFEIADLRHVWLMLDLYETDLPWIHPFQNVRITAESLPGREYSGRIIFVDPVVNDDTRTIKVRVSVDNSDRELKPQMYVNAEIVVGLDHNGRALVPPPVGAFGCSGHPWERAESAGVCPICKSALVRMDNSKLPQATGDPPPVLCVPKDAVLQTGQRVAVYSESTPGSYLLQEITIGPLAQDATSRQFYPVLSGLQQDQLIVTRGNFLIDSQRQIAQHLSAETGQKSEAPESTDRGDSRRD